MEVGSPRINGYLKNAESFSQNMYRPGKDFN